MSTTIGAEESATPPRRRVNPFVKTWLILHLFVVFTRTFPLPLPEHNDIVDGKKKGNPLETATAYLLVGNMRIMRSPQIPIEPENPDTKFAVNPVSYYMETTGLWQYWDMFAPNPSALDYWIDAKVTLKNGESVIYDYPRMKKMGLVQKYLKERYRKYTERLNDNSYAWKWPHTSYWVAAHVWTDPNNPPVKVVLRRHWIDVQPPGKVTKSTYTDADFYSMYVDANVLKGFKK